MLTPRVLNDGGVHGHGARAAVSDVEGVLAGGHTATLVPVNGLLHVVPTVVLVVRSLL